MLFTQGGLLFSNTLHSDYKIIKALHRISVTYPGGQRFRQRLHGTESVWNRYEIGMDKPCVYTGPGGSGRDRIRYLVPIRSTYEGDPVWNRTVPV